MTTSKHTPGPWTATASSGKRIFVLGGEAPATRVVCLLDWPATNPGNARLIAASPVMLAALEGVLASFADCVKTEEALSKFPALKAVSDAIKLATGGK